MYKFIRSMGVIGLFFMVMIWMYGEIALGVGILVIFSFVCMVLGIMVRIPPLAGLSLEYLFWFGVVVFELLYIIL
jgi:hypothetical protein